MSQEIILYEGQWIRRRDVIKYCANIASGVHSSRPTEIGHLLIDRVRRNVRVTINPERVSVEIGPHILVPDHDHLSFDPKAIDLASLQLLSACQYLSASPDVTRLMDGIRAEFRDL